MIIDFVTADSHFNHLSILRHCERPFLSIEDHDEALIASWNEVVSKKSTTIIIGDFAWKNADRYLGRLNGKKILILGNHDHNNQEVLRNFTKVENLWVNKQDGLQVTFCHYPMASWPGSCYPNSWHLHGHCHGRMTEHDDFRRMDCGVDVSPIRYAPIPWEFIAHKMRNKSKRIRVEESENPNQRMITNRLANEEILKGMNHG